MLQKQKMDTASYNDDAYAFKQSISIHHETSGQAASLHHWKNH